MNELVLRRPHIIEYPEVIKVINSELEVWQRAFTKEEMANLGIGEETVDDLIEAESSRHYIVAERDGKIVGFASWYVKTSCAAWVSMIQVLPACQGQGVGTQLLHKIESDAKDQGLHAVTLETQKKAAWATQFYLARGYSYLTNETASHTLFTDILSRPLSDDLPYVVMGKILN